MQPRSIDQPLNQTTELPPTVNEQPLSDQYNQHIFSIVSQRGSGSGFRAPDGRIVTNLQLVEGGGEVFAVQNGKRYKLGKNVAIDDVNGLAVLGFVDVQPPGTSGLPLASRRLEASVPISIVGYHERKATQVFGEFTKLIPQEDYRGYFGAQQITSQVSIKQLSDAVEYAKRPLLEVRFRSGTFAPLGAAIVSKGEVQGIMTDLSNWSGSYAIPVEKIATLVEQKPENSKFVQAGQYESGLQKYVSDLTRAPGTALQDSFLPGAALAGFVGMRRLPIGPPANAYTGFGRVGLLGASTALIGSRDLHGFLSSTNVLDTGYFGSALAADGVSLSGAAIWARSLSHPKLRPLALGVTALGLTGRLGCELIPNKYVLQAPVRTDGDSRKPFSVGR